MQNNTQDLIIDASNLLHRVYWVANNTGNPDSGNDMKTSYLFLQSLKSSVEMFKPQKVWMVWDKKIKYPSTNFRKQITGDAYKQTRDNSKAADVFRHCDILHPFIEALGIPQIYPYVLEADDVIAWLAQKKTKPLTTIVSVDKDLLQLVSHKTQVYSPIKKLLYTVDNFHSLLDVNIKEFVTLKAILGDPSDNIPRIEGYGTVRARKLLAVENKETVLSKEEMEQLERNINLMDLTESYKKEEGEEECLEKQFDILSNSKPDLVKFKELCEDAKFYSLTKNDMSTWRRLFCETQALSRLETLFA